jgi:hypothetical protein
MLVLVVFTEVVVPLIAKLPATVRFVSTKTVLFALSVMLPLDLIVLLIAVSAPYMLFIRKLKSKK